jgi:hypothetical protein
MHRASVGRRPFRPFTISQASSVSSGTRRSRSLNHALTPSSDLALRGMGPVSALATRSPDVAQVLARAAISGLPCTPRPSHPGVVRPTGSEDMPTHRVDIRAAGWHTSGSLQRLVEEPYFPFSEHPWKLDDDRGPMEWLALGIEAGAPQAVVARSVQNPPCQAAAPGSVPQTTPPNSGHSGKPRPAGGCWPGQLVGCSYSTWCSARAEGPACPFGPSSMTSPDWPSWPRMASTVAQSWRPRADSRWSSTSRTSVCRQRRARC